MRIIGEQSLVRCDNCDNQYICLVKQSFEKSLLDSRIVLKDEYADMCTDNLILLARHCKLFQMNDDDFYGNNS